MKLLLSIASISATGGGIASVANTNITNNSNVKFNLTSVSTTDLEISTKNISELSSIDQLKTDNKIQDLKEEKIDTLEVSTTTLDTYYSAQIYPDYIGNKSDSTTFINQIFLHQGFLQDILKEQIKLSNEKKSYTLVEDFVKNSSQFSNTSWEIASDASGGCKLQKAVIPIVTPSPTVYDQCKTTWQIITFDLNKKIKEISEAESTLNGNVSNIITQP